ncbi:outer membrane beta-barrel protein [Fluviicola sp.]|uniref:outer membrane beta-barrel protein n=1 Tax=Fluviicola sp. TaxID=1917219 RepID=UPI00263770EE|nr:outer membrane beta-barrel protein [Fluviicola sp.]
MKRLIKKTHLFTGILLLAGTFVSAQKEPTPKLKNYLEVSYGPNTTLNFQSLSTMNGQQDQFEFNNINSLGTLGLRYDHLLTPSFSLGIDFYYLQRKSTGTVTEFNSGIQSEAQYIVNRFKTQIRIAYHFPISNPNIDVYIGGGVGMNNQIRKLIINGTTASRNEYPLNINLPVSLRTYAGLRYSFSKHFGVNAELGIGGPLFNAGFHFRF